MIMIISLASILAILEIALFASITMRTSGKLFIIELCFLAASIILTIFALISLSNKSTARFLLQIFFLAATANAILLYLTVVLSPGMLLGIVFGLLGLVLTFVIPNKEAEIREGGEKRETKHKRTEIEKQLGPIEEEPKVIIEEAPKKPRKRRKKARRRRR